MSDPDGGSYQRSQHPNAGWASFSGITNEDAIVTYVADLMRLNDSP